MSVRLYARVKTIQLPESLHKQFKSALKRRGISMRHGVREAIIEKLHRLSGNGGIKDTSMIGECCHQK